GRRIVAPKAAGKAAADGSTLLQPTTAGAINATLYEKLNFNFIRDITPVAAIYRAAYVMATNLSVPAKTVSEFVAHAKSNPGKLNVALAGVGGASHLSAEMFKMMTGINVIHVPYSGSPGAPHQPHAGSVAALLRPL